MADSENPSATPGKSSATDVAEALGCTLIIVVFLLLLGANNLIKIIEAFKK